MRIFQEMHSFSVLEDFSGVSNNGGKCLTTPFGLFLKRYIGLLQGILTRFSLQDGVIAGSGKNQKTLYQRNATNKDLLDSVIEIHKAKLTQSQVIRI